jgi:hypothetical protein
VLLQVTDCLALCSMLVVAAVIVDVLALHRTIDPVEFAANDRCHLWVVEAEDHSLVPSSMAADKILEGRVRSSLCRRHTMAQKREQERAKDCEVDTEESTETSVGIRMG